MKYIDKINSAYAGQGKACSQKILDDAWNDEEHRYVGLAYTIDGTMKQMRKLLVNEQEALCCYCMRKLYLTPTENDAGNVTLEHIIPHKITKKEWEAESSDYLKYDCLQSCYITVCTKAELSDSNTKINDIPHPHFISYHNLVASCDGAVLRSFSESSKPDPSHCCNNKRGNKFVKPLYLKADQASQVYYDEKGIVYFPDEKRESGYENILNLNDVALKMAREFWYHISKSSYSINQVESACNDENLREEILDDAMPGADTKWGFLKKNENAWCWFSEYSWFYDYYRTHYPLVNTPA